MRVAILGSGNNCDSFIRYLKNNSDLITSDDIVTILDNDIKKCGREKCGISVQFARKFDYNSIDALIITPTDNKEIRDFFSQNYPELKLFLLDDYIQQKTIEYQYNSISNDHSDDFFVPFNQDSLVIYTAITNGYDKLKDPISVIPNAKYICFTDDCNLKSDVWEVVQMSANTSDRKVKLLPHLFLPEFDTSIWVDASFLIVGDLLECIKHYQKQSELLFFPHPQRRCIYDEIAACVYMNKADKVEIYRQLIRYIDEGYPQNNNLLCGGFIVRNHNSGRIVSIMEQWWDEYEKGVKRDQISLPYVLWKNQYKYDLVNANIFNNKWLYLNNHF